MGKEIKGTDEFRTKPKSKEKLSLSAVLSNEQEIQRRCCWGNWLSVFEKIKFTTYLVPHKRFLYTYGAEAQ